MLYLSKEEEFRVEPKIQALYFYASWMPLHKKMLTMISKMEEKHTIVSFVAIDTDHFIGLCRRFSVDSIPSVVILKDGLELKRIKGLVLTSAFRSIFADICNSESQNTEKSND